MNKLKILILILTLTFLLGCTKEHYEKNRGIVGVITSVEKYDDNNIKIYVGDQYIRYIRNFEEFKDDILNAMSNNNLIFLKYKFVYDGNNHYSNIESIEVYNKKINTNTIKRIKNE